MPKPTALSPFQADPNVRFTLTLLGVRHGAKQSGVPNNEALLNDAGKAQVAATGRMLSESFGRVLPSISLSSNLGRAIQTADVLIETMAYAGHVATQPSANLGYLELEQTLAAEVPGVEEISAKPEYASASAKEMAELIPGWATACRGMMQEELAAMLRAFDPSPVLGNRLPDGSLLGVLGNHSPMLEFVPNTNDWDRITKRAPASGIVIPIVVYNDGRVEIVPGAECFNAGLLSN